MASDNKVGVGKQEQFRIDAKTELLKRHWTITDLARAIGKQRNTVSLAINNGLFKPTQDDIRRELGIS